MLRLEYCQQKKDVSITLRGGEAFLCRRMFLALAVALGLHLLGVFVFEVRPFPQSLERILAPTRVEAFTATAQANTASAYVPSVGRNGMLSRRVLELEVPRPKFLGIPVGMPETPFSYVRATTNLGDSFDALEHFEDMVTTDMAVAEGADVVLVTASGALSGLLLLDDGVESFLEPQTFRGRSVCFDVHVDGRSGRVFWHRRVADSDAAAVPYALIAASEEALRALLFQKDYEHPVVTGRVEYHGTD